VPYAIDTLVLSSIFILSLAGWPETPEQTGPAGHAAGRVRLAGDVVEWEQQALR
jgi:hypothetical protein